MSGKPKRTGWNVNLLVKILHDPELLNLSAGAFSALVWLLVWAASEDTNGTVPARAYTPAPPMFPGLPHVTDKTLDELEEVGLIWGRDETGLEITWEGQTNTAEQRKIWRETKQQQSDKEKTEREAQREAAEDDDLPA